MGTTWWLCSGEDDELSEEGSCRLRVEAVVHVGGPAHRISGDRDRGDDVGRTQEVRAAGVAVTGPTVAGAAVHGDPQPGLVDRVQLARGDHPAVVVEVPVSAGLVGHLVRAV